MKIKLPVNLKLIPQDAKSHTLQEQLIYLENQTIEIPPKVPPNINWTWVVFLC